MARVRTQVDGDEKPADGQLATDEPLAAWEQELLQRGTAAEGTPAAGRDRRGRRRRGTGHRRGARCRGCGRGRARRRGSR